jgi:hypothetical protein
MSERSADDFDLTDPAGYRHWTTITIRYRDLDPLGHINNSVYSEWFEAARVILTRKFSAAGPDWLITALARMTINFLAETTWPGEVREPPLALKHVGCLVVENRLDCLRKARKLRSC